MTGNVARRSSGLPDNFNAEGAAVLFRLVTGQDHFTRRHGLEEGPRTLASIQECPVTIETGCHQPTKGSR